MRAIETQTVTVRETTLFDAVCVALESGEFHQIRGQLRDAGSGRCVWGVAAEVSVRAGMFDPLLPGEHVISGAIERRAGELLGCDGIAGANDAGHSLKLIAAALRRARLDVEAGVS